MHEQCFQARRIVIDLVILPGLGLGLCSSRLSVLLPATGAQSERLASIAGQTWNSGRDEAQEREGEHALADQGLDRVLQSWVAPAVKQLAIRIKAASPTG